MNYHPRITEKTPPENPRRQPKKKNGRRTGQKKETAKAQKIQPKNKRERSEEDPTTSKVLPASKFAQESAR